MVRDVWPLIEPALNAEGAEDASLALFRALAPYGASYLQTRVYSRPLGPLTSASHFAADGFVVRMAPEAWAGSPGFNYICFENNPLLEPIRAGRTRWRFDDYAPRETRRFGDYWDALSEAGVRQAWGAVAYGANRRIASLHLGADDREADPDRERLFKAAGTLLVERLLEIADPPAAAEAPPRLTVRERECLALVADGKTDWEISVILTLSEATVRFHVDNARRKLGAVTRAQAAARLALAGMI